MTSPLRILHFLYHSLQALLELTPEFCSCHKRAHIKRHDFLILYGLWHITREYSKRQPLCNGCFPDAGLTDEHRIVLCAPREHLEHAPDLVVPAYDRIKLAALGKFCEVAAVFFERLVFFFRILVSDA